MSKINSNNSSSKSIQGQNITFNVFNALPNGQNNSTSHEQMLQSYQHSKKSRSLAKNPYQTEANESNRTSI